MNPLELAYIIGFSLAILTLIPVMYGVFVKGLQTKVTQSFFTLLVISTGWTIIQLLQVGLSNIKLLLVIEVLTTVFLCLSVYSNYIFTVIYTDSNWLLKRKFVILSLIPFFVYGLNLIYKRIKYTPKIKTQPFIHPEYQLTVIDNLFMVFIFVIYTIIFLLLLKAYSKSSIKNKSILLFIFGLTAPVLFGFIAYIPKSPLPPINHAPLGFPVLAISMAIAVFGLDMLDIEPIALEHFAEELPDPIFILDKNKNIITKNKSANDFFIRESESSSHNRKFSSYFDSKELEALFNGNTINQLFGVESKFGHEETIFTVTASPVRYNESLIGWVVHMKDITELENQKRELERQNEQLQRFSDGVTHELRNPLTVASQYTELYFEGRENEENLVETEEAQEKISNAHTRIDEIIESVEWLSKYGQTITETEPVSVREAATEVWHSLDKDSNAELSIETDIEIMANKTRLKTAFDNLFKNSLRYASPNPEIKVWAKDGELYIEDNGPGISSEDIEDIFEYGYTTSEEGTGFGLPVVKTIIESHGWEITVDTSYENGARFVISNI